MGRITLTDARAELEEILGSRSIGNTRIDRWLHMALDEIVGSIDFQGLMDIQTITTVSGQQSYALTSGTIGVSSVTDTSNDKSLIYTSPGNFQKLDEDSSGSPKIYTYHGDTLYLWPTPNSSGDTIKVLRRKEHPTWTTGSHSLPASWDPVVISLAAHYGFAALEELDRSEFWLRRAIMLIRSRREDTEIMEGEVLPVRVAESFSDLVDRDISDWIS